MEQLWEQTLGSLKGHLSNENFETWLRPVQFGGIESDSIVLRIPNQFFAEWIAAHYLDMILDTLQTTAGETPVPKKVRWELDETLRDKAQAARESTPPPAPRAPRATPKAPENADLNPKYRFKNFVVGPANQLAHAASVACGSDPGRRYNPLFIYGGVGLGKTHLGQRHRSLDHAAKPSFANSLRIGGAVHERVHLVVAEPPDQYIPGAVSGHSVTSC